MSPTYDSSGAQRSEKNDPTRGGRSFRDVQKAKRANAKEPKPTSSPSAKGVRPTVKSCTVCFAPGTLVRSIDGYVPIESVSAGDVVLSSDGTWQTVLNTISREYSGEIVRIRPSCSTSDILVTPEHPFLKLHGVHPRRSDPCTPWACNDSVKRRTGKPRTLSCHCGDCKTCYSREWARKNVYTEEKTDHLAKHWVDWAEAGHLAAGDYVAKSTLGEPKDISCVVVPEKFRGKVRKRDSVYGKAGAYLRRGPTEFDLTPDFLWMIGMYLAEGSSGSRSLDFALHRNEVEFQERLISIFKDLGYNASVILPKGKPNSAHVQVNSSTLAEWFPVWLGHLSHNKAIPAELMNLPMEKLMHVVRGLMDGDGCYGNESFEQTSRILALQVAESLERVGGRFSVLDRKKPGRKHVYRVGYDTSATNGGSSWHFCEHSLTRVRHVEREDYHGMVYNLEVGGNETYVVEGVAVHNCSSPYRDDIEKLHAYGMSQADIIKHFAQFDEQYHLSKGSLSNHLTKHVTLMDQAYRRMLDKEAQKRFDNIEEVADNLLTNRAMLEVMRQKAYNAIVDESVEIEPETALKIIDKLAADDARQSQEKIDEMVMEMNLLIRTIKQVVPESMWTKIAEQYKTVLEIERDKRRMIERGQ